MLLTETIKNSTSAIKKRRATIESKQHAETYARALAQLSQSTGSIKDTLDCANAIKESGIVEAPVIDEATRSDLLACINDCGNGISEMRLSMDAVRLLKSKGDAFATQIKIVWRDASAKYSDGSKGYLSMIGGLSSDPKRAKELADNITKTVAGDPSIKAVKKLVADVSEAKKIADEFSLNPEIEVFLKKVSSLQATVAVADGLFCREIDGLFCRSSPDIIVRRRCVLSHKRRGWLQPSPSFRYSRNLALQDELYHPVINNGPAVLVCVDKRLGTGPVNQSRDAG